MKLKNKKVLVTGACGFIGSHLVEALLDEGCDVRAFVFYNSFNSWGWLDTFTKDKLKKIDIVLGDIRDSNGVRKAVEGVDVIFHLAALVGVPFSYHSPDSYVETNIKGTLNILQASRDFNVEKVIVTSTSEVYGTAKYVPMDEAHPLQAQSPYAASKIASDKIAQSFYFSFGLPVIIARPFNTYGPRQSLRAVIPTVIKQALSGSREIELGSLHPKRDFTYVKDTCKGFIHIAKAGGILGEVINIASGRDISVEGLAKNIINQINPKIRIASDKQRIRPKKSEVDHLLGSNKKIKKLTGWRPEYGLADGLKETIEWFRLNDKAGMHKTDIYNV